MENTKKKRRKISPVMRARKGLYLPKRKTRGSAPHESQAHLTPVAKEVGQGLLKHAVSRLFASGCKCCGKILDCRQAVTLEVTVTPYVIDPALDSSITGQAVYTHNYCDGCWDTSVDLEVMRLAIGRALAPMGACVDLEYVLPTGQIVTIPGSWRIKNATPTATQTTFDLRTSGGDAC